MKWKQSLSGDLAETVVYQGPILDTDMELGAAGFWNNNVRPDVYYLKNQNDYFDATRAEIVGDIDGKHFYKQIYIIFLYYHRKICYYKQPSSLDF